jgi:hypothetical protein
VSTNVKELFSGPVWEWLINNTKFQTSNPIMDKSAFWIIPSALTDPELKNLEKRLLRRFSATKILFYKEIDEYHFRLIQEGDGKNASRFLLICRVDGSSINLEEDLPFEFEIGDATFLQQIDFITNCNIPAKTSIPERILMDAVNSKESIFEADLKNYLPQIISWKVPSSSPYYGEDFAVVCVRALININKATSHLYKFSALIIELALSIPSKEHDWLYDQLYLALMSRKKEYFFLGLYQLLEFFFPIKSVSALKKRINYTGTFLELRAFCSESLGWNINHHSGARAALLLTSENFANVCLGNVLPSDASRELIEKHKLDAIGKISELRHLLAHQNFAARKMDEERLNEKTQALLALLTEAFDCYKRLYWTEKSPADFDSGEVLFSEAPFPSA